MKIAAQVYSVRKEAEKDFAGTMAKLKSYGYDGVELAGLYGLAPEQVRDCLQELGLTPISAHVGLNAFREDMEGTLAAYRVIGCSYIAIPSLRLEDLPGGANYPKTRQDILELSARCREAGIRLLYHNHSFEFVRMADGRYVLDALFADLTGALDTQFDTCWVSVAGEDPVAYLEKYQGRCPLVHLKDYLLEEGKPELCALGEGVMNVRAVAGKAQECGAEWGIVEQDDHKYGSPLENMKKSRAFLAEKQGEIL